MITADVQIRVRYAETDQMGYVYYGNYAIYYEVARGELLRKLGLDYVRLENDGFFLPIAKLQVKYIKPAHYDELLTVRAKLKHFNKTALEFEYEIYNQNNELINKGYTLQVIVDGKTRKPSKMPDYLTNAIKQHWKD